MRKNVVRIFSLNKNVNYRYVATPKIIHMYVRMIQNASAVQNNESRDKSVSEANSRRLKILVVATNEKSKRKFFCNEIVDRE